MSVKESLQAIYDQNGTLTPEMVVAEARAKDHPLHAHIFDKPPKDAAEAWYRHKAHDLIQSVRVVYRDASDHEQSVRAFHAVRSEEGYVYKPTDEVVTDPFLARLVLADMEREWKALRTRYERFQEFWQMVDREAKAA